MIQSDNKHLTRRGFVGGCLCLAALTDQAHANEAAAPEKPKIRLYDLLTPEELKFAQSSDLVRHILEVKGGSCAETVLLAVLRYLDLPEERLHSAMCFGGGILHQDLCGMLTGGIMALGNAAGVHHHDHRNMKRRANHMASAYWQWWMRYAPLHCRELKPNYDRAGYVCMKQRVALKLEQLIADDAKSTAKKKL